MQSILSSGPTSKDPALREGARCLKVRCAKPLRAYGESYVFLILVGSDLGVGGARTSAAWAGRECDGNESGKRSSVKCHAVRAADC